MARKMECARDNVELVYGCAGRGTIRKISAKIRFKFGYKVTEWDELKSKNANPYTKNGYA
ncbi:hypothetical protein QFZ87_004801 [Bacillus sp. SLBN-46]|uniref:hypothetical protein n=1 Tax=Bacillus sp. SLBN-46 TaxID=3042283 RepID=UPI0028649F4A|nr:hypothetical protein [Bacillus sp. SLBN-46]MDR6125204.1 hypothetical protein [Bacillus sp. SLBN-46]